jgi:hypothetical protein
MGIGIRMETRTQCVIFLITTDESYTFSFIAPLGVSWYILKQPSVCSMINFYTILAKIFISEQNTRFFYMYTIFDFLINHVFASPI